MGTVDAAGLRNLAARLDEASSELDDLTRRASRLGASAAMWRLPLVAHWQQGHATRLRTSARIAEDLDAQHVDWERTLGLYGLPTDLTALPPGAGEAALTDLEAVLDGLPDDADAAQRADAVAAFFTTLTPLEQSWLVTNASQTVGNLDGVPNPLRYAANRLTIERTLAAEQARYDADDPPPARTDDAFVEYTFLGRRLERYREFLATDPAAALAPDGERSTPSARSFLMFSPPVWDGTSVTDDGRVAEVIGNLDTATNIAVMVPGISNRIDNFDGMAGNARTLRADSGDPGSTAVVAWLGYDTPEFEEAVATTRAEEGAPTLRSTIEGMRRSTASEVTVLAHSYGTVLTGQALQGGFRPDRVVLFGSPGLGHDIHSAADLGLPPGYPIYALRAPGDWITYSEGHGDDPVEMAGITRLDTGWDGTRQATGHSQYYERRTGAFQNIIDVMMGRVPQPGGDRIVEEQHGGLVVRRLSRFLPAIVPPEQQYALLGDLEPIILQAQYGQLTAEDAAKIVAVLHAHGLADKADTILTVIALAAAEEASRLASAEALEQGSSRLGDVSAVVSGVVDGAQGAAGWAVDGLQDLGGGLVDGVQGVAGGAADLAGAAANRVVDGVQGGTGWVVDGAQSLAGGVVDDVQEGWEWVPRGPLSPAVDGANLVVDGVQSGIGGVVDGAQDVAGRVVDGVQGTTGDLAATARERAGHVVDGVQEGVGDAVDATQEAAGDLVDGAQRVAGDTVDDARDGLESVAEKLLEGRWPL